MFNERENFPYGEGGATSCITPISHLSNEQVERMNRGIWKASMLARNLAF